MRSRSGWPQGWGKKKGAVTTGSQECQWNAQAYQRICKAQPFQRWKATSTDKVSLLHPAPKLEKYHEMCTWCCQSPQWWSGELAGKKEFFHGQCYYQHPFHLTGSTQPTYKKQSIQIILYHGTTWKYYTVRFPHICWIHEIHVYYKIPFNRTCWSKKWAILYILVISCLCIEIKMVIMYFFVPTDPCTDMEKQRPWWQHLCQATSREGRFPSVLPDKVAAATSAPVWAGRLPPSCRV